MNGLFVSLKSAYSLTSLGYKEHIQLLFFFVPLVTFCHFILSEKCIFASLLVVFCYSAVGVLLFYLFSLWPLDKNRLLYKLTVKQMTHPWICIVLPKAWFVFTCRFEQQRLRGMKMGSFQNVIKKSLLAHFDLSLSNHASVLNLAFIIDGGPSAFGEKLPLSISVSHFYVKQMKGRCGA